MVCCTHAVLHSCLRLERAPSAARETAGGSTARARALLKDEVAAEEDALEAREFERAMPQWLTVSMQIRLDRIFYSLRPLERGQFFDAFFD